MHLCAYPARPIYLPIQFISTQSPFTLTLDCAQRAFSNENIANKMFLCLQEMLAFS